MFNGNRTFTFGSYATKHVHSPEAPAANASNDSSTRYINANVDNRVAASSSKSMLAFGVMPQR